MHTVQHEKVKTISNKDYCSSRNIKIYLNKMKSSTEENSSIRKKKLQSKAPANYLSFPSWFILDGVSTQFNNVASRVLCVPLEGSRGTLWTLGWQLQLAVSVGFCQSISVSYFEQSLWWCFSIYPPLMMCSLTLVYFVLDIFTHPKTKVSLL